MKNMILTLVAVLALATVASATQYNKYCAGDCPLSPTNDALYPNGSTRVNKCSFTCVPARGGGASYGNGTAMQCIVAFRAGTAVSNGSYYKSGNTSGSGVAQVYPVSATGTTVIEFEPRSMPNPLWSTGVYKDDLTGTTYGNCVFTR